MLAIWWIWATHTLYANRFDTDNHHQRLGSLALMFLVALMASFCGSHLMDSFRWFTLFYVVIRAIQAAMYWLSRNHHLDAKVFSCRMVWAIVTGTVVSVSAVALPSPVREVVFALGVVLEMVVTAFVSKRADSVPVHLSHLVERVGLLSIIVLGESLISLVGGLQDVVWTSQSMLATGAGFLIIGLIWWIYFDSFHVLERARRLKSGLPVLYASFAFCVGMALMATAIRFGIEGGLVIEEFQYLAVGGILLFYIGKQVGYFIAIPVYRKNILVNSTSCVAIAFASFLLAEPAYVLGGIAIAMGYYVFSNYRWTLTKDASAFLEP